jgi:hypothetical protein
MSLNFCSSFHLSELGEVELSRRSAIVLLKIIPNVYRAANLYMTFPWGGVRVELISGFLQKENWSN